MSINQLARRENNVCKWTEKKGAKTLAENIEPTPAPRFRKSSPKTFFFNFQLQLLKLTALNHDSLPLGKPFLC